MALISNIVLSGMLGVAFVYLIPQVQAIISFLRVGFLL